MKKVILFSLIGAASSVVQVAAAPPAQAAPGKPAPAAAKKEISKEDKKAASLVADQVKASPERAGEIVNAAILAAKGDQGLISAIVSACCAVAPTASIPGMVTSAITAAPTAVGSIVGFACDAAPGSAVAITKAAISASPTSAQLVV
ncbi:MAG: hypothetical protein JHD23_09490, partial [Akkermansiaceae bacterium]|nr:hypothetical protein [Akkermansiaceae bacterium]